MNRCQSRTTAPGPSTNWPLPLRFISKLRRDPHFFLEAVRRYGPIVRFRAGVWSAHLLSRPEHVKHVLQDRSENYPRSRFYRAFEHLIGKGLLANEGPSWQQQRQKIQPAFHPNRLAGYVGTMAAATSAMLSRWQAFARSGETFDLTAEIKRLTLSIIGRTLCGIDLDDDKRGVGRAATIGIQYTNYRMNRLFAWPVAVPTKRNREFRKSRRLLDKSVYEVIAKRRFGNGSPNDLMAQLLQASEESNGQEQTKRLIDRQLRDQVMTFILTGHETSAAAINWTWYLLDRSPDCEHRMRAEVSDVLRGSIPTFATLAQLKYTEMVLEESMRLYPPVWRISRQAIRDDEIDGYHIPGHSIVVLCPYVTQRLPELWTQPEKFDPDRFAPDQSACRPLYSTFPFAGGPHRCIGHEFAIVEATLIMAMISQRFRLRLVRGQKVEPEWSITLRPKESILATISDI
jgi:cytochrome P450